jgi:hypothetical protein
MFWVALIMTMERWRRGPTAGHPRSSDLNPPGFYLWGYLMTLVSAPLADNKYILHHAIVDVCQTICNYSGIFGPIQQFMIRHVEACIGPVEDILST